MKKNWHVTSYFWRRTSFLAKKDVFLVTLLKMSSLQLLKIVFRLNCQGKSCSPWRAEYFEKRNFVVWRLIYDVILAQKDVFLTIFDKMSSLHPFKVVFRLNCKRKSCSTWCFEYSEKRICRVTSHFWCMTSFLAQKDVFLAIFYKNE